MKILFSKCSGRDLLCSTSDTIEIVDRASAVDSGIEFDVLASEAAHPYVLLLYSKGEYIGGRTVSREESKTIVSQAITLGAGFSD